MTLREQANLTQANWLDSKLKERALSSLVKDKSSRVEEVDSGLILFKHLIHPKNKLEQMKTKTKSIWVEVLSFKSMMVTHKKNID